MERKDLRKFGRDRFYIIDGNGYVYRAFFALPRMNTSKGIPTNAVYGFANMIRKLLKEEEPEYIAVAFDSRVKTFRHAVYEEYKGDRPEMPDDLVVQMPYIRRACQAFGLPVLESPGFEADDIIATLMERCKEEKLVGVVVTSDKDLLQLVDDRKQIFTLEPMKDQVFDEKAVEEKWGVGPGQIADILSLTGDSIDNIPGVKGIGPKGALDLIRKFGSVEKLLSNIDLIEKKSHKQKIQEHEKDLRLSRELILLRKDVPVDAAIQKMKIGNPDREAARDLLLELEFYSMLEDYLSDRHSRGSRFEIVTSEDQMASALQEMENASLLALNCETDASSAMQGKLVGLSFSVQPKQGWYIPVGHDMFSAGDQLDLHSVIERLKPLLEEPLIVKCAYHLKHQILVLRKYGVHLSGGMWDPMLMSYVQNPTRHAHRLEDLAKEYLQYQVMDPKEITGTGQKQISLSSAAPADVCDLACEKTDVVLGILPKLKEDLEKTDSARLYQDLELPVLNVLCEVEWNGVRIDRRVLSKLSEEMGKNLDRLVADIYEIAGEEFNINSPKQIGQILFTKLRLPRAKRTRKTKDFSTSVDVLEELAKDYEMPQKILEYRQFTKLKSTYVDTLPAMIDPQTGRVHTDYQQTVAATGRLSSVEPNLQNIPIRTPWGRLIRDAFVPEEGNWLISGDYSQIELRVMAHLSGDETLIDSFLKDEDIHARTASEVFGIPMDLMTKEIRNQAKAINYGINYGQSPFGLSQLLGIDQKKAKDFIDRYFEKYPKVHAYIQSTLDFVRENGYVETMFGRRRYIPEIRSRDRSVYLAAERAAVNSPLQGTAADIIKLAMIAVQKEIESRRLKSRMIMQVHDELVFETPDDERDLMAELAREKMQNVCKMKVPLTVDISIGKTWLEAK